MKNISNKVRRRHKGIWDEKKYVENKICGTENTKVMETATAE